MHNQPTTTAMEMSAVPRSAVTSSALDSSRGTIARAALLPTLSPRSLAVYYAVVAPVIATGVAFMMVGGTSYSVGTWIITGLAAVLGICYTISFVRTDGRLARRCLRRPDPVTEAVPPHWTLYVDRDGVLRENPNRG